MVSALDEGPNVPWINRPLNHSANTLQWRREVCDGVQGPRVCLSDPDATDDMYS